ncbi:MAG: ABC transporter substrate-binding protein [Tannerellaceae bacterium]|jgi:iron complex transport system substrate-binding protein|nr:ABC transporter substrate-binding protein [Tannerellaceae bacterium]
MKRAILFTLIACLAAACAQPGRRRSDGGDVTADSVRYARGFSIHHYDNYTVVDLTDPWDTARLLQRYVLVDRRNPLPPILPTGTVVMTPLRNIVVYTSVHAAIIEELGEAGRITGVCEPQYINSPAVRELIRRGEVADLGMSTAPNVEKMVDMGAECIIASPFQNSGYGQAEKLGIPIIEAADYMEALPLGRAEWVLFYGLLLGRRAEAEAIFRATEERYLALRDMALGVAGRPEVFSEKRYGSFWYVPSGDSYMARLFHDAGADYSFAHIPGQGSTPLVFETVLDRAVHAGFWLIKYNQEGDMSYRELRSEYAPYENFDAFRQRNIYACNTNDTPYYEEFPMHPDYLLGDLIHIFHPSLLPGYTPRYYRPLSDR